MSSTLQMKVPVAGTFLRSFRGRKLDVLLGVGTDIGSICLVLRGEAFLSLPFDKYVSILLGAQVLPIAEIV